MDRGSLLDVDQVAHGGTADHDVLDFGAAVNPAHPTGVASVYESSLSAAKRLPMDDYAEFRTAAAERLVCEPRNVVPVAGVFDGLRQSMEVSVDPGDSVLMPVPACGEYDREVRLQGGTPEFVPTAAVLDADPEGHAAAIVDNPTDPTGRIRDPDALCAFAERCREAGTTLVVDERFLGFVDEPSVAGTPGTVAVHSVTNVYGLPGLRAGVVVATGDTRERLERARGTFTISSPAAAVATHCLGEEEFRQRTVERVRAERPRLVDRLDSLGFDVVDGEGPLVLFSMGDVGIEAVLAATRTRDIAVRDARTYRGLDDHVRLMVRRPTENDRLIDALGVAVHDDCPDAE